MRGKMLWVILGKTKRSRRYKEMGRNKQYFKEPDFRRDEMMNPACSPSLVIDNAQRVYTEPGITNNNIFRAAGTSSIIMPNACFQNDCWLQVVLSVRLHIDSF